MKLVVQRVLSASVTAEGAPGEFETTGRIGPGLVVLLGVMRGDGEPECDRLAADLWSYRVFADDRGKMNRSAADLGRSILVVSQFTLAADGRRGRRPSFDRAAPPAEAEPLYERFVRVLRDAGAEVATGRFGATMRIQLEADGPATFLLERASGDSPGPAG